MITGIVEAAADALIVYAMIASNQHKTESCYSTITCSIFAAVCSWLLYLY